MRARREYTSIGLPRPERLRMYNQLMNEAEFEQATSALPFVKKAFFSSVGSTNDVVAEWAREGFNGLCLAAADEQTQGRGRSGRRWFTPAHSALAFSLLLENTPILDPTILGRASGLGALAVCEGLGKLYKLKLQIKWPNDVLADGQKICGVLPEAHWSGERLQALILGIGINIAASSVPPQETLNFPATSLETVLGSKVQGADALQAVLERLIAWKDQLNSANFMAAWEALLAYKGEQVNLETGNGQNITATLLGLSSDGSLRLQMPSGEVRAFQAGEIQLRPLVDSHLK